MLQLLPVSHFLLPLAIIFLTSLYLVRLFINPSGLSPLGRSLTPLIPLPFVSLLTPSVILSEAKNLVLSTSPPVSPSGRAPLLLSDVSLRALPEKGEAILSLSFSLLRRSAPRNDFYAPRGEISLEGLRPFKLPLTSSLYCCARTTLLNSPEQGVLLPAIYYDTGSRRIRCDSQAGSNLGNHAPRSHA